MRTLFQLAKYIQANPRITFSSANLAHARSIKEVEENIGVFRYGRTEFRGSASLPGLIARLVLNPEILPQMKFVASDDDDRTEFVDFAAYAHLKNRYADAHNIVVFLLVGQR